MIKTDTKYYPKYIGINNLPKKEFVFFKQRIYNAIKRGDINTKPVINKHTGFEIFILNVKHGLNQRGSVLKTKSFTIIRDIIKYALLFNIQKDKNNAENNVFYFINIVLIDGLPYEVRITIKFDSVKGKYYYHHDLMTVKMTKKINPTKI